jgi:2-phospho-L-lactate/phosphoenolpyruvate guanylyltransferase
MTYSARFSWTVLLPVKVLARAKSRLAVLAGDRRRELALALASDTVTAVLGCPEVARVVVVTSDPVAGPLLAALGAIVIADEPADRANRLRTPGTPAGADAGAGAAPPPGDLSDLSDLSDLGVQDLLNAALRHGATLAARRWPGTGLAALTADLPAMSPAELATALRAAAGSAPGGAAFVPDAAGVGTTLYAVPPGGEFLPLFGGASRARHAAAGATELALAGVTGLRRDVDTPDDLREALTLGAGPFTRAVAADLFTDV